VVAVPVAITLYLTWWFVTWVDGLVRPFVPIAYRPETYLPFGLPGSGLIVAVFALTMLGFLTANLIGRTLVDLGDRLLGRIPAVGTVLRAAASIVPDHNCNPAHICPNSSNHTPRNCPGSLCMHPLRVFRC